MTSQAAGPGKTQKILTIALIVLGVAVVLFFGLRTFRAFGRMRPHGPPPPGAHIETDVELIRGWMTIPYVARAYAVPEPAIYESLNLTPVPELDHKSLADLNKDYFSGQPAYVLEHVKEAVTEFQKAKAHPTPTP
jgi:hypothetical protein